MKAKRFTAVVRPTLELMLTDAGVLERRLDPASGLALIAPEAQVQS